MNQVFPAIFNNKSHSSSSTTIRPANEPASKRNSHSGRSLTREGFFPFSDAIALSQALIFITFMPIPICIIDSGGEILGQNTVFYSSLNLNRRKDSRRVTNILQIISSKDYEKFYSNIQSTSTAAETNSEHTRTDIGVCSLNHELKQSNVSYEWILFCPAGESYIIVSALQIHEPQRISPPPSSSLLLHGTSTSLCSVSEGIQVFGTSSHEMDDAESDILDYIPKENWDIFKTKVENKTKKVVELKEAQLKAEALELTLEIKRTFVRHVSHEIRTPLNVVMSGFIILSTMRCRISDEDMQILEEMQSACTVAVEILNDLLTYEKLDSNLLSLDKTSCEFVGLLEDVVKMYRLQSNQIGVTLTFECKDAVKRLFINGDAPKLMHTFRNLLSNAVRFTPRGGKVSVYLLLDDRTMTARVEVHDTGPGVPMHERSRLFGDANIFRPDQLNTHQGSGLGLYLAQQIVRMHEGSIGIDLAWEGQGSIFYVELPYLSSSMLELPPVSVLNVEIKETKKIKEDLHFLVVDDVQLCRKIHCRVLGPNVRRFSEACNGQEAVDKVRESLKIGGKQLFDAVLIDNAMPVMNGTMAAQLMRELGYKGKIYGITGNALKADIDEFLECGADEVLIKPLKDEDFMHILTSV